MFKHKPIAPLLPHFVYGGDYNPDQWLDMPEIIEEDMRLQKLAHCNAMTLGIFCWTILEPEDGVYDFSYLDMMIEKIGKNGGKVVLATPSGAKPAWMAQKYPEILRVNERFERMHQGERHNHCLTSPVYRRKIRELVLRLSERYGKNETVIAWHISNEFGGQCRCEYCQDAFRDWLRERYGTLDEVNRAWCTKFWNHTYTKWSQIEPPSPIGEQYMHGLVLDWKRFTSDNFIDYMKVERDAIREHSDRPITTNMMRHYPGIDYRKMARELDFVSWDAYPKWHRGDDLTEYASIGFEHDFFRSMKNKPFWLMECTPSLPNWHPINKLKRPGVNRLGSLQAIAHGSDSVQYFQWRKSRGASEKFHGAVVDHLGTEHNRVFREAAELGKTLEGLDEILGAYTKSDVAILYELENRWAIAEAQGFNKDNKKFSETLHAHYRAMWDRGINTDIIGYDDDFSKYKLIIAPMIYMVNDRLIEKIEKYVREGGKLVTTYMAGMVNENDLCYLGGFPGGKLGDVFGIWNEEIDSLYPEDENEIEYRGESYKVIDYCEIIHTKGAEVLSTFGKDFYAGSPALTVNKYGCGEAYYIAFRDTGDFLDKFLGDVLSEAGVASDFRGTLPLGVSAHSRTDGENTYIFVGNYEDKDKVLSVTGEYMNFETGEMLGDTVKLAPYGSMILKTV